ncbi:MAG: hypothetical protein ACPLZC_03220 [Candidatus Bathyarchaeales archaeon]
MAMFDWLNVLTFIIGLCFLFFGIQLFRLTRKTTQEEMVSLFQDTVKISRRVAYLIVIYCWIVGGTFMIGAIILQLA